MTTDTISPLRQRMIEDMNARMLSEGTQRGHIRACKRFAAFLKRSPDTAAADDVRRFQLHLIEDGASIHNRNRIMTGVRFLFRITLRRHDLAADGFLPEGHHFGHQAGRKQPILLGNVPGDRESGALLAGVTRPNEAITTSLSMLLRAVSAPANDSVSVTSNSDFLPA